MPSITITISDLPNGQGAIAMTDGDPPAIGRALTPAQALAMDLLRICRNQADEVRYGADEVPLVNFAKSFLDPERLGHAATIEMRDNARVALGRQPVEGAAGRAARREPMSKSEVAAIKAFVASRQDGFRPPYGMVRMAPLGPASKQEPDLLRQCHLSGQMSAAQSVAHAAECATPCGDHACDTGCTTARRAA